MLNRDFSLARSISGIFTVCLGCPFLKDSLKRFDFVYLKSFSFSNLSSFGYLIVQLSRYCCICALSERQLDNIITLFSHCQQKLLLFLKKNYCPLLRLFMISWNISLSASIFSSRPAQEIV